MAVSETDAYISTDSGITWSQTWNCGSNYGAASQSNTFIFPGYGAGTSRVYNSTGGSYVQSATGMMRLKISPTTGTLIGRAFGSTIYRSTDGGSTFSTATTVSPTSSFNSGLTCGPSGTWFHSYVDTSPTPRTQQHMVSTDDGVTWSYSSTTGLPATTPSAFAGFCSYMNGAYHAWLPNTTSGTGLYTSPDALTWTFIGTVSGASIGGNYGDANGVFYRNGYYYAKGSNSYIYRSTNGYSFTTWGSLAAGTSGYSGVGYSNGNWLFINGDATNSASYIRSCSDPNTLGWTLRYTSTTASSYPHGIYGLNQDFYVAPT
jgi:hypothetical protein